MKNKIHKPSNQNFQRTSPGKTTIPRYPYPPFSGTGSISQDSTREALEILAPNLMKVKAVADSLLREFYTVQRSFSDLTFLERLIDIDNKLAAARENKKQR